MNLTSDSLNDVKVMKHYVDGPLVIGKLREFYRKSSWAKRNKYHNRINKFLSPHSEDYFSVLRPLFLHQVHSPDVIRRFSPLLARDGLLSLLYFFYNHPQPPSSDVVLCVNKKLSDFVPDNWIGNTAYYSCVSTRYGITAIDQVSEIYLIFSVIDERQCSLSYLEKKLDELMEVFGNRTDSITFNCIVFFNTIYNRAETGSDEKSEYYFHLMKRTLDRIGFSSVRYAKWEDVKHRKLKDSVFVDLNEFDFYYSDSYVVQYFLRHGAIPLRQWGSSDEDGVPVDVSFYHQFRLFSRRQGVSELKKAEIDRVLECFSKTQPLVDEDRAFGPRDFFTNRVKWCPLSFETMAYELAKKTMSF